MVPSVEPIQCLAQKTMEKSLKRKRSPETDEVSGKRSKNLVPYLLCGVYEDGHDDLSGDVFTPFTSEGEEVIEQLLKLSGNNRSEALGEFTRAFEDDIDFTEKEQASTLKIIKRYFPCLKSATSLEHVRQIGTLKKWRENECLPVIPIFTSFDY